MWPKTDMSQSGYSQSMDKLVKQYNNLTLAAERCRRDNFGKMTVQEAEYYNDAARVCEQIISLNLTEDAIRQKWMGRKKTCLNVVEAIADKLAPKPPVPATPPKSSTPAKQPTTPPAVEQAKTDSGFVTKNACEAVPADVIEGWHQKKKPKQSFDALSGMEGVKKQLLTEVARMGWTRLDEQLDIKPTKCYFFYGPPGSGKSTIIKAFVHEMMERDEHFHFIKLKGSDIRGRYLGDSEKAVQIVFQEAMDNEPCLVYIDEIDEICRSRGDQKAEGHDSRTTVAFLQAIDDLIDNPKRVIFMAGTNYPDRVDSAMMSRVKPVKIPLPDEEAKTTFFIKRIEKLGQIEEGLTFADMAEATDNYSYRDLEKIIESIAMKVSELAMAQCMVYDENGAVDQEASDQAAAAAVAARQFIVTRAMFQEALENNPPTNTAEIRERLRAFEESIRAIK